MIRAILMAGLLLAASPASAARESLGVFDGWGSFRDDRPTRCFAVAEPVVRRGGGDWRPFASISFWPARAVRGQIHIRLRRAKLPGAPVTLAIGDRRFALIGGGGDAWAPDPRTDATIVAAMRSGTSLSVETRARDGRAFVDAYRLRGAATAIDAAALGCARRG
ncbi:hypothetical protein ABC347_14405 [Sphingomonas sp. 1P06PA]|uniref:hypothetical protein n=1 Tax=Sphingomonas sp. 1P06PA TaxID=554121 RepID=UPI0039A5D08E